MGAEFPTFEAQETREQKLIAVLKKHSQLAHPEDVAEVKEALDSWSDEQQQLADKSDKRDSSSRITLNRKRGWVYFMAGCLTQAAENYNDALDQAELEGNSELFEEIMKEMDDLEATLKKDT